jgi:hypothetical protein
MEVGTSLISKANHQTKRVNRFCDPTTPADRVAPQKPKTRAGKKLKVMVPIKRVDSNREQKEGP